jgi:molecular chaperone DnaK
MTRTGARTIGIDLGTTNSCVATIDADGRPRILKNRLGDATTPSTVSFVDGADGRPLVGMPALRHAVTNPEHTIFGAKRLIGRRFDDPEVQALAATLPYRVVPAPNGDSWVGVRGMTLSPPEVSALILAELRIIAEEQLGGAVDEAIITVPAYFDNQQRQATKDAAEIAGLRVRRLLNEPTAAALGYGAHRGANRRFAVCDLGGGTFDVSIVNVENGVFEVISTHGDAFLGGDDIDRTVIENLVAEIYLEHDIDVAADAQALQRLKEQAQAVKHQLSASNEARVDLRYLAELRSGAALDYARTITRIELEAWSEPILARLEPPVRECLARCGLSAHQIDAVILVGGMTRMPAVQARIGEIFGRPPLKVVNPDEIVSIGAATQCAILDGTIDDVVLLDVTSRALGLDVGGGRYQQVIPRNATIPTREHKIVATVVDGQTELAIDVYEGESPILGQDRLLGRFVCSGLPAAPAGNVLVLVELTVDVDGILRVAASQLGSDARPELRLTASAGLSRREVRLLAESLARQRQAAP